MLRFSPVFGLSRSVAHVSFHFLHVIFPRGGFRFGEFIRCMPKSRTVRQPPAGFEPCAGCRQPPAVPNHAQDAGSLPTVSFLRGFIHACLLTVSARTFPPVLCFLFFPICIFIIIFSFLYFLICASLPALFRSLFTPALFHSFFSVHAFPSVLPAQRQNAGPKTKHPAQRQNANSKTELQTRRNTGMVSRGAGQTIVVPPS